jgi:tetratricopeptide (TPR) repeat protein
MNGSDHIRLAYEAILAGDFERSIECFLKAIALEPGNASYHYKLSITYARSNKLSKAIEHAELAVRLDPDEASYRAHLDNLMAKQYIRQAEACFSHKDNQLHLAIAFTVQAIALDPLALEAYVLQAVAYSKLEEFDRAVLAAKQLLKLDPQHAIGMQLLAENELKWQQYIQLTLSGTISSNSREDGSK